MVMSKSRFEKNKMPNRLVLELELTVPTEVSTATTPPAAGWQQVSAIFDGGKTGLVLLWPMLSHALRSRQVPTSLHQAVGCGHPADGLFGLTFIFPACSKHRPMLSRPA